MKLVVNQMVFACCFDNILSSQLRVKSNGLDRESNQRREPLSRNHRHSLPQDVPGSVQEDIDKALQGFRARLRPPLRQNHVNRYIRNLRL